MGSKSSKWLVGLFAAAVLASAPAGAVAKLDYSRNSVDGHYLAAPPRLLPQINDISVPAGGSVPAPVRVTVPGAQASSGFSWADASAGAGAALLLALTGAGLVRRRHASPLVG